MYRPQIADYPGTPLKMAAAEVLLMYPLRRQKCREFMGESEVPGIHDHQQNYPDTKYSSPDTRHRYSFSVFFIRRI